MGIPRYEQRHTILGKRGSSEGREVDRACLRERQGNPGAATYIAQRAV